MFIEHYKNLKETDCKHKINVDMIEYLKDIHNDNKSNKTDIDKLTNFFMKLFFVFYLDIYYIYYHLLLFCF